MIIFYGHSTIFFIAGDTGVIRPDRAATNGDIGNPHYTDWLDLQIKGTTSNLYSTFHAWSYSGKYSLEL